MIPRDFAAEFVRQLGLDLSRKDFALPPYPDTALRIREALRDPNLNLDRLGTLILAEPALSVRLLRIANSAMLKRGPTMVTDIGVAISRIGLKMVESITVMLAAREAFPVPPHGPGAAALKDMRRRTARVAVYAWLLAREAQRGLNADDALLVGTLSGVGRLYILWRASDFTELLDRSALITELLEHWQGDVARAIVEYWGFPEAMVLAMDERETIGKRSGGLPDLGDVLVTASRLCDLLSAGESLEALDAFPPAQRMRLNSQRLTRLLAENEEAAAELVATLSG